LQGIVAVEAAQRVVLWRWRKLVRVLGINTHKSGHPAEKPPEKFESSEGTSVAGVLVSSTDACA
jgi:hypothetical protein